MALNQYLRCFRQVTLLLFIIAFSGNLAAFTDPPAPSPRQSVSTQKTKKRSKLRFKKKAPKNNKLALNIGSVLVFLGWLGFLVGVGLFIGGVISTVSEFWFASIAVMGGSLLIVYTAFSILFATGGCVWGIMSSTTVAWITQGVGLLAGLSFVIWGLVRSSQIIWGIGGVLILLSLIAFLILWLGLLGQGQV